MQTSIENVLIAEDDQDDFDLFKDAITESGYSVSIEHAENGEILLKVLNLNVPDILFLDIHMPCKDGKQCLKEIRENPRYDAMPVIMYTSSDSRDDVEHCYRQRANMYAIKPTSFKELKNVIQKIFSIDWAKASYFPPLSTFIINTGGKGML